MRSHHYQVGGSLSDNAPSYIERRADRELYNALKQGEFCYVLNSRQVGKSSLLVRTRHQLEREGFKCASIDMTNIGSETITPTQWYKGIAVELWRGFKLLRKVKFKTWWAEREGISVVQKLSQFIAEVVLQEFTEDKLFIFIDEIDSVLSLNFPIDDFFALIRFCYNQRSHEPKYNRLSFAIFGVATPSDLISDKKRTPFNIGKAIELQGFQIDEIDALTAGLTTNKKQGKIIVEEILRWTAGQPFLTQKLCQIAIESGRNGNNEMLTIPPGAETFWVESLVKSRIIHKWELQDEPEHLRTIRDRIKRNETYSARLLGIYQKILQGRSIKSDDSREQIELILSGLVIKSEGKLKVKNRIYQEIFNLEWVEKQLEKLRPYSEVLKAWIASHYTDESRLLRGRALEKALEWSQGKSLSDIDYQFLKASQELDQKEMKIRLEAERGKVIEAQLIHDRQAAKVQQIFLGITSIALAIASILGITAFLLYRKAIESENNTRMSEIQALVSSSNALLASRNQFDSLIEAIKATQRLQEVDKIDSRIKARVHSSLRQAIYKTIEYNRLSGHNSGIWGVAYAPDGETIATASKDGTANLWNREGQLLATLEGHKAAVLGVAFAPDGRTIATASEDNTAKLWDVEGNLLETLTGHDAAILDIVFSPDGEAIATMGEDSVVKLWTRDGQLRYTLSGHNAAVWGGVFSPDGETLITVSTDTTVKFWSREGQLQNTFVAHDDPVWDVAISPDGQTIATTSSDRTVKLWTREGGLLGTLIGHESRVLAIAFSSDNQTLATASEDNTAKVWTRQGQLLATLTGHDAGIWDIAFSPKGDALITASDDKTAKLWNWKDRFLTVLIAHEGGVWDVEFLPDGQTAITGSEDKTAKMWTREGQLRQTLVGHEGTVIGVAVAPDGQTIATASRDSTTKLWQGNREIAAFPSHDNVVFDVEFAPSGDIFATASADKTAKLWNVQGELQATLLAHEATITDLGFAPDGQTLATASLDGTVKFWNLKGELLDSWIADPLGTAAVAFSPDGETVLTGGENSTAKLWSRSGELLATLSGHNAGVWGVAFSPNNDILATVSWDKTAKLWTREGKLLLTLIGHDAGVMGLSFSPDGNILATASWDGTAILWHLERILNLDEFTYACNWVRDYLRTNMELSKSDRHLCDRVNQ
ncbi:MAG: AAA-like domain-containing protein [Cyanobacteria bacterium SBLK]|nr:AAA-like domain-containing protein [Cyanobacteria bacterium SBLK]